MSRSREDGTLLRRADGGLDVPGAELPHQPRRAHGVHVDDPPIRESDLRHGMNLAATSHVKFIEDPARMESTLNTWGSTPL